MLTVAYEITALARNPFGGIAQTCYHTLVHAASNSDLQVSALYRHGNPENVLVKGVRIGHWAWHSRITSPRCRITHALCHRLPTVRADRNVYTIHDVWSLYPNPYQGPEFQKRIGRRMRRELVRSDMVIADSEWTRQRLVSLDIVKPEICHVVPLGVAMPGDTISEPESPDVRRVLDMEYVLFVGRLENRKNIPHILEAVRPHAQLSLVLVGEPGYGYEQVEQALENFPRERIVRLKQISSSDLVRLYRGAVATLIPSWEEGFGLPILEAMAAGCPVITSDRSASAEIARDAAILVDPSEPMQSRDAIARLLEDTALRERLVAAGVVRASEYTWSGYFGKLLDLYRSLI
jgi:glycosyltransferase involved in cell wall biosynthesis